MSKMSGRNFSIQAGETSSRYDRWIKDWKDELVLVHVDLLCL
jgi:hypothetical protein